MMLKLAGVLAAAGVVAAGIVTWRFAIFVLPFAWTGEADRLARQLMVQPGNTVADIGAGDGAMAFDVARRVGDAGTVYATELDADRRRAIADRIERTGTRNVRVVEAAPDDTRLPPACCDALYLRTVFHHVADKTAFARALARTVRPGGRVAVIDFAPGGLWFHGGDHGVSAEDVLSAAREAGLVPIERVDNWGGGTYLLLFER